LDTMQKELARLVEKVDLLIKEGRYTHDDFGRAVDDKVAEATKNIVAMFVAEHAAELAKASVAADRLHDA